MNLDDFRADLVASAASRAEALNTGWREAFVTEMLERLREAGEVADAEPCVEQLTGPRNRRLALDAYALDEADESLNLFIALPDGSGAPAVLTLGEAHDQGFGRLLSLYDAARSGWLSANIEESRPLWSLAGAIMRSHYSALRLNILSDRALSERVREIPDDTTTDGTLITFQVWDVTRLKRIHDAASIRDDLIVDLSFLPGGGLRALAAANGQADYDAYLAVIPGEALAAIYARYGSRLLEGNVRTFLGRRGNVNKGIQGTLDKEPSRFFAYNNGIAATASDVTATGDGTGGVLITAAIDLQIVNGAQTMASLASANRAGKLPEGNVFVPMKLSVVAPQLGESLIPLISRYANSQNAVRPSDFFANHPFHRRLEEMSRRILAPAAPGAQYQTYWYYERARGQYLNDQSGLSAAQKAQFGRMNPKQQVMTKTDLAKVETCFGLEPDVACKGAEKAFVAFANRITTLWKDDRKRAEITDDWYKSAVARTILFRRAEQVVSKQGRDAGWYEGGYRAQVVAYICARLVKLAQDLSDGGGLDYQRLWNQQCDLVLDRQLEVTGEAMMRVLRQPPREGQNISEWAKQQACRETALRTKVQLVDGFDAWLADRETVRSRRLTTRATGRLDEDLRIIEHVMKVPVAAWLALRDHARNRRLMESNDEAALRTVCGESRLPPNEIQAKLLKALLERAAETGWELPETLGATG